MPHIATYTQPHAPLAHIVRQHLESYNADQASQLAHLPNGTIGVFAYDARGVVVGGAYGEYDWGWVFVDTVWTSEAVRGQGIASACLLTLEAHVRRWNIQGSRLMTSSFQARPLYEKLGYEVFGVNRDRPPGHDLYHMMKAPLSMSLPTVPTGYRLKVQTDFISNDKDLQVIEKGLMRHAAQTAPIQMHWLGVGLHDEDGELRGGAYGNLFWGVLEVHFVALEDAWRGQGWGRRLMLKMEMLARQHGASAITLDTADFQARPFYEKLGYEVFGQLPNRPPGHTSYFMQKILVR